MHLLHNSMKNVIIINCKVIKIVMLPIKYLVNIIIGGKENGKGKVSSITVLQVRTDRGS